MAIIAFPATPAADEIYEFEGRTWKWNGFAWRPQALGIEDGSITDAKLADAPQATIKGRPDAAGTGVPSNLTATQVRTILNVADGANAYSHPNHTGDVTSVGDGAQTIAANAVTFAKFQQLAQAVLVGRAAGAGTGNAVALTPAQVRTILGVGAFATGAQLTTFTGLGGAPAIAIPTADEILGFVDLRNAVAGSGVDMRLQLSTNSGSSYTDVATIVADPTAAATDYRFGFRVAGIQSGRAMFEVFIGTATTAFPKTVASHNTVLFAGSPITNIRAGFHTTATGVPVANAPTTSGVGILFLTPGGVI